MMHQSVKLSLGHREALAHCHRLTTECAHWWVWVSGSRFRPESTESRRPSLNPASLSAWCTPSLPAAVQMPLLYLLPSQCCGTHSTSLCCPVTTKHLTGTRTLPLTMNLTPNPNKTPSPTLTPDLNSRNVQISTQHHCQHATHPPFQPQSAYCSSTSSFHFFLSFFNNLFYDLRSSHPCPSSTTSSKLFSICSASSTTIMYLTLTSTFSVPLILQQTLVSYFQRNLLHQLCQCT